MVDTFTECNNKFHGLRARITIVALDGRGRAIGVSQEMSCTTRGGILDIFSPSSGRDKFAQKFPESVGEEATSLEIFQDDETGMGAGKLLNVLNHAKDVRAVLADFI
ncbi:hypothetical protein SCHPADRAFT_902661 [Schizopora paradoxa]|uniref:Uncharacterized protein n=1 Tax=Schizopora paradoxa TaxID=27342 RepID=A0A0H2SDM3_9AGAM|nr:hypothetical protein SCHPADRAFT_902661 [Schizopora paradoxa]